LENGDRVPPQIPDAETFVAMYVPTARTWETDTHRFREFGTLYLTSERLIWQGGETNFEIPSAELTTAGLRTERFNYHQELHIGVGLSRNPSYTFEVGKTTGFLMRPKPDPGYDHFLTALKDSAKEAEGAQTARAERGGQASAADELGKFARLREQGVISDAEFEAKKAQLLGL